MNTELIKKFQSCCEFYFEQKFEQNRFLYFDKIPHNYFGTDFKVEITRVQFEWLGEPELISEVYSGENQNFGKQICKFKQSCLVNFFFRINSLIESARQIKTLQFYAHSFEPFGLNIGSTLICEDLIVFDKLKKIKLNLKSSFQIENIDEVKYDNDSIGFGFFTDILRKNRITESNNEKISNHSFYSEIAQCHIEIEECLLTALFHQQYLSDLLGRKYEMEGGDLYLPNLSYNDHQYLLMIGFGFDRLYSFWDRIIYLLASYESVGINPQFLSFDKYFKKVEERIRNRKCLIFDINSTNLIWFLEFYKNQFIKITDYRHRIVHYQMTQELEGVLTSKFSNNASELANNLERLKKLKLEFEGLGYLLYEQYNFCKDGFVKALHLIDELA
jgi:hypothetical protein